MTYKHKIILEPFSDIIDVNKRVKWCSDVFGPEYSGIWLRAEVTCILKAKGEVMPEFRETPVRTDCFCFKKEEDAIMFKLVWGGHYSQARRNNMRI